MARVDLRIITIFEMHVKGVNAPEGSEAKYAAFKRRDELVGELGGEQRSWLRVVCHAVERCLEK